MSCQLWSYWTEFHEIFTRYRGIIYAVNAHIEVAISRSVSGYQSDEWREFAIFYKIGCHGNVPWDIGKRSPDRSSAPKTLSFGDKIVKIGPADPDIIVLREIIKKKKKELNASKIYSPDGKFAERAKPGWYLWCGDCVSSTARVHQVHPVNADSSTNWPPTLRPSQISWVRCESAVRLLPSTSAIAILLLLRPKADTHFTVPRRVEGWVDLCTDAAAHARDCISQWLLQWTLFIDVRVLG